jgi:ribosomal protein L29
VAASFQLAGLRAESAGWKLAAAVGGNVMAKPAEYRGMSDEQLQLALNELVKNLFHLRFQSATDRLETPSEILKAKREVARIKTIMHERHLKKATEQTATQGA